MPHRDRLIQMLASAVGDEKGRALIDEAVAALGLVGLPLSADHSRRVLDHIARQGGAAGAAARLAAVRLNAPPPRASSPSDPASRAVDVVALFAPTLGQERASEVVSAACRRLSLPQFNLSLDQALRLLDALGSEPGLTGVTARFARARLMLKT